MNSSREPVFTEPNLEIVPPPSSVRAAAPSRLGAAGFLVFASGAAGLAYQVIWTRRLVDVLGASPETFAKVIGAFCIGLALGGAVSALRPATYERAWLRVAIAELTVALLSLIVLAAIPLTQGLRLVIPSSSALKLILPVLLITPPATAMGLVLPAVLVATRIHGSTVGLYAVNMLGGVLGIGLVVFAGFPSLGLIGTGLVTGAASLGIALAAWKMQRRRNQDATDRSSLNVAPPGERLPINSLAFGSGFVVLGLEVVAQHQFAQVTVNSHFSGAIILTLVLLALTAAALIVSRLRISVRALVPVVLASAAVAWTFEPLVLRSLRPGLQILPYEWPARTYFPAVGLLALVTLGPGFLTAGFLFPLLLRNVRDGRSVARLLALNGLGGWLGAELTQALVLPAFGLWRSALVAAAGYWALLIGLRLSQVPSAESISPSQRKERAFFAGRASVKFAALALLGVVMWHQAGRWPQVSPTSGERVVEVAVGREGVVATVARETNDWRIVFNNAYTLGGSRAQANQEREAHLPLLLHGRPESVAVLGVATGSTLAGAALHSEIERLDAFELSPLAARFAQDYFAPFNRAVFHDPRVKLIVEDARWGLTQQSGAYDVVIGDLFLPWRTGEGRLFTREHFAEVRRSLRPSGLYCQWLPWFQLTRSQYDAIVRTFQQEFPRAFLLRGDFYTELPIVGLCGFKEGRTLSEVDWAAVETACKRLRTKRDHVTDPLVRHAEGVAMCVVGELPPSQPGPINTLSNAWLEWDAGRNIIGLREPWFIGVPAAEYLRDLTRSNTNCLPTALRSAQDSGQFFLTLEIAAKVNAPVVDNLRAQMPDRLPGALRDDSEAQWSIWPMRIKPFHP